MSHSPTVCTVRRIAAGSTLALILLAVTALATHRMAYAVTNGISMRPRYHTGDLVIVKRESRYRPGQIVAYRGGESGRRVVLHRIIGGDASGFVTKGDNNESIDPVHPTAARVIGRAILHIPRVGAPLRHWPVRGLLALLLAAAVTALFGPRRSPAHPPVPRHKRASRLGAARAPRAGRGAALIALDAALIVAFALTFVTHTTPASPPPATQTGTLGYSAAVPVSETYPSGRLQTGDPIFLRLLTDIGVTFHYSVTGDAGTTGGSARVDVDVSTPSGWRSRLAIAPPAPLKNGKADLAGVLDLGRVQSLTATVSQATGVPLGTISMNIIASVDTERPSASPSNYTIQLPMQLNALEATMANGKLTPSPEGPVVASTEAVGGLHTASRAHPRASQDIRFALLAALMGAAALTVLAGHSVAPGTVSRRGVPLRVRAVDLHFPDSPRIRVAHAETLEELATRFRQPLIEAGKGWSAVIAPNAVYWRATRPGSASNVNGRDAEEALLEKPTSLPNGNRFEL